MPGFLPAPTASAALLFDAIYVMVATLVHAGVVLLAGTLQPLLTAPARRRQMGAVFGLILLAVAAWVALATSG